MTPTIRLIPRDIEVQKGVLQQLFIILKRYSMYIGEQPTSGLDRAAIEKLVNIAAMQATVNRLVPPPVSDVHIVLDDDGVPVHIHEELKKEIRSEAWQAAAPILSVLKDPVGTVYDYPPDPV